MCYGKVKFTPKFWLMKGFLKCFHYLRVMIHPFNNVNKKTQNENHSSYIHSWNSDYLILKILRPVDLIVQLFCVFLSSGLYMLTWSYILWTKPSLSLFLILHLHYFITFKTIVLRTFDVYLFEVFYLCVPQIVRAGNLSLAYSWEDAREDCMERSSHTGSLVSLHNSTVEEWLKEQASSLTPR